MARQRRRKPRHPRRCVVACRTVFQPSCQTDRVDPIRFSNRARAHADLIELTRSSRALASLFRCAGLRALSPPVREATSGPFDLRLEIELHGISAPPLKVSGNFTLRAALGEAEPLRLVEADLFPWGTIQNSGLDPDLGSNDDPWHLWAALGFAHPAEAAVSWPRPPQWAAIAGAALGRSPHLAGCQGPHLSHSAAPRPRLVLTSPLSPDDQAGGRPARARRALARLAAQHQLLPTAAACVGRGRANGLGGRAHRLRTVGALLQPVGATHRCYQVP